MIEILSIIDPQFVGDTSNTKGVVRTLEAQLTEAGQETHTQEYKLNEQKEDLQKAVLKSVAQKKKVIIVSAGDSTLPQAIELKSTYKGQIFVAWSAHQLPTTIDGLDLLDQIALPKSTIPETHVLKDVLGSKLVQTTGVPHNLLRQDLQAAYVKWQPILEQKAYGKPKMLVMLSGDAPDETGQQRLYTPEEAIKLGQLVAQYAKDNGYYVYITNGPRTGKHSADLKVLDKAHRGNIDPSEPTDAVSQAFVTSLQNAGCKDYYFSDFRYGQDGPYKALLHSCKVAFIPGESTSMISEASDFMPDVKVYHTKSMNINHEKSLQEMKVTKNIDIITLDMELIQKPQWLPSASAEPAAAVVARNIANKVL